MTKNEETKIYEEFKNCYEKKSPEELIKMGEEFLPTFQTNMASAAFAECCRLVMLAHLDKGAFATADVWRARALASSHLSNTPNVFVAMFISIAMRAVSLGSPSSGLDVLQCMEELTKTISLPEDGYPSRQFILRLLHEKRGYLLCRQALLNGNNEDFQYSLASYDVALNY